MGLASVDTTIMKIRTLLILMIALSVPEVGQNKDGLSRVTLFSSLAHNHDFSRTSLNFDTGEVGFVRGQPNQNFDLSYGTVKINADGDWFEVRDARSRIVDLGVKGWDEVKETPPFPQSKTKVAPSLDQRKVIDASAGSKDVSPLRQIVSARTGHMYLVRVAKGTRALYVMFRVENLITEDNCQISWKRVVPPNIVDEQ